MEEYIPDVYGKSIYTIDYTKLWTRGIKCLLFDLDNTIVPSHVSEPPKKAKELFTGLKQKGFKVIIFTNSPMVRLRSFMNYFGVDGVSCAFKPFTYKLKRLLRKYHYTVNEMAIIGDQMMTDVKAGNKTGITTVLIEPVSKKDFILTKINRHHEKNIMKKLRNYDLFCKGRYYD